MIRQLRTRLMHLCLMAIPVLLLPSTAMAAELDAAIESGFGKLVKYGRWAAALLLAIVFCLAWAERGQNPDNPHEVNKGTKKMIWSGAGFVAVIGYKMILSGLVSWFGLNPDSIPTFLWQ
ncbi:MAG: hypothetical protein ACOY94_06090 [Bacillota bacterium]